MSDLSNKTIQLRAKLENHYFETEINKLREKLKNPNKNKSVVIIMESCKELGNEVLKYLEGVVDPIDAEFVRFGNNEFTTFPKDSVRKKDIFIMASGSNINGSINDHLMALYAMIFSCKNSSAAYITVILPYFPYSRSDKKDRGRMPILAKMNCDIIKEVGADRIITVDLHAAQIQAFFSGPFDNLYAINPLILSILDKNNPEDLIVVSPDAGGEKRANAWADVLDAPCTFFTKKRDHTKVSTISKHEIVHHIEFTGKTVLLVDDMGDTLGTLCSAAVILKEMGAVKVIGVVTHGILSGKAFENLNSGQLDELYVTNTLPQKENLQKSAKLQVTNIAELMATTIVICINGGSLSQLFAPKK